METPDTAALAGALIGCGMGEADVLRAFRSFNGWSEPFRAESRRHEVPVVLSTRAPRRGDGSDAP